MSAGKVFLGVLAGVAAGALLGVLFAPDKGSETRRKLLAQGEDLANAAKEKFDDVVGTVNERIDKVKESVTNATKKAMDTVNEKSNTTRPASV